MRDEEKFPLHTVAAKNNVLALKKLLSDLRQGDIALNQKNTQERTPLHEAAQANVEDSHFKVCEFLLEKGANINARDAYGKTPLYYLLENGTDEIVELFLRFNVDVHVLDNGGRSLLVPAAVKNNKNPKVLQLLIDLGLDVNHQDNERKTPLCRAAFENKYDSHYDVAEILLKSGADVNKKGYSDFYYSTRYGSLKIVELFLSYQPDVHALHERGRNMLFSFSGSNVEVMQKLIDLGLDVNHRDEKGETPLHLLYFFNSNIGLIKCLLKSGANINAVDEDGVTPLIKTLRYDIRSSYDEWYEEKKDVFDFIIEQNDFSVAYNDINIFNYYYYDDDYIFDEDERHHSDCVWKWILEHLAKLQSLNITMDPSIKLFIIQESNYDYNDYFNKCIKELEVLKNTKLQNCWVTFHHLLTDNRRKLKNYVGNKDLIKDFQFHDCVKEFPIYGETINKNVEKGLRRRKLFDKCCDKLCDRLPIFNPRLLIVRDIFDCIVSKKDLSKFCE